MAGHFYSTPQVDFSKAIDETTVKNRTVLITGGASGIGLGMSTALAKAGAFVFIVDVDVEEGEKTASQLQQQGYKCEFISADVASYKSQLASFKFAIQESPTSTVDVVVPCAGIAGISIHSTLSNASENEDPPPPPTKTIDVNLYGVYFTTYLALFYFRKHAAQRQDNYRPQILFVSSLAGYSDLPMNTSYAAAKFGVRGLFRALRSCAAEMGGLRCNLLAPSFILTPFTEAIIPGVLKQNILVGDVEDAVEGGMRCLCDPTIEGKFLNYFCGVEVQVSGILVPKADSMKGRAICIAAGKMTGGSHGSANFDLCDDIEDYDAGRELLNQTKKGTFGSGLGQLLRLTKESREAGAWQGYRA